MINQPLVSKPAGSMIGPVTSAYFDGVLAGHFNRMIDRWFDNRFFIFKVRPELKLIDEF
jgi:hypothetical protein